MHYCSQDRESVRFDQGGGSSSSQSIPANLDLEAFTSIPSRERFVRRDRLPGDVLLARERLVERLRGIQLTGRRFVIHFVHFLAIVHMVCKLSCFLMIVLNLVLLILSVIPTDF